MKGGANCARIILLEVVRCKGAYWRTIKYPKERMRSRIILNYLISAIGWVVTPFNILRKIKEAAVKRNNLMLAILGFTCLLDVQKPDQSVGSINLEWGTVFWVKDISSRVISVCIVFKTMSRTRLPKKEA